MNDRSSTTLIFTGGDPVPFGMLDDMAADCFVVAADSGIEHALAHGRHVDLAVGDFDSVSDEALLLVADRGAVVQRHPCSKDKTDLELAMDAAMTANPSRVILVGGHGGRLDHAFANLLVLLSESYASQGTKVEARMGTARVMVVRDSIDLAGAPGGLVTLLAVTEPVAGITTRGLRYPFDDATLRPGSSRGVSNEFVDTRASVQVRSGPLLVIQPGSD